VRTRGWLIRWKKRRLTVDYAKKANKSQRLKLESDKKQSLLCGQIKPMSPSSDNSDSNTCRSCCPCGVHASVVVCW
jgi:hypothetical protein